MKLIARIAWLVSLAGVAAQAQDAARVEPLHFHHVHLNSTDPAAEPTTVATADLNLTAGLPLAVQPGSKFVL